MSRSRGWCFTDNADHTFPDALPNGVIFYIAQLEEVNHRHLQGYFYFKNAVSFTRARAIRPGAHIEKANGTPKQNIKYCTKEESRVDGPWELGERPIQGKNPKIDKYVNKIKTGVRMTELIDSHAAMIARYPRLYSTIRSFYPPPQRERTVILLYGPTGIGKTRSVREICTDLWVMPPGQGFWFDGYDNHSEVLFDDFSGASSKLSLTHLLQILDRYIIQVPVKGGFCWFNPGTIYITTNIHPDNWYDYSKREEHLRALYRRITYSIEMYANPNGIIYPTCNLPNKDY